MNLEDYAKHIYLKNRFITAVSVLRTKPPDLTIIEYIEKLRENLEEMDVDLDATMCSDDIGDEKIGENRMDIVDIEDMLSPSILDKHIDSILNDGKASDECVGEILSPSILEKGVETCHSDFNIQNDKRNNDKNDDTYFLKNIDTDKTFCSNSIENLQTQIYTVPNDSVFLDYDNLPTIMDDKDKLLKGNLKKTENDSNDAAIKYSTPKELNNVTKSDPKREETKYTINTICSNKTLYEETQVLSQNNDKIKQIENLQQNRNIYNLNNTILSQQEIASQIDSDNIIEASQVTMKKSEILYGKVKDLKRPLAIGKSKSKIPIKVSKNKRSTILQGSMSESINNTQDNKTPEFNNNKTNVAQNKIQITSNIVVCRPTTKQEKETNENVQIHCTKNLAYPENSPETNIFTEDILNTNLQHSKTKTSEKHVNNQIADTNDVNISKNKNLHNTEINLTNQSIANIFDEIQNSNTKEINFKCTNLDKTNDNVLKNIMETKKDENDDEILEEYHKIISKINFDEYSPFAQMSTQNETNINSFELIDTETQKKSEYFDNSYPVEPKENDEIEENQKPITLSIYEEMHKAKSYINRRTEWKKYKSFSSESGYKSDTKTCSEPNETTILYTGMTLYKYLLESEYSENNEKICETVSEVLGELVDYLYSEDNCPKFMTEMLEKCTSLLEEILDENSEKDYITKEENVYIFLFFNTSYTILTDTLEKLAQRLEKLYDDLFNGQDLYEIINFDGLQNQCYLFHILEILLKRYLKLKKKKKNVDNGTQSTQSSSKNHLIDVWKKKWDPNYSQREVLTQSQERPCCIEKFRVILDKIIQKGVDGYSLVSFAALQCYNLLHS